MTRKAQIEGKAPSLADAITRFKVEHPDKWEELRLCPAQHALDVIAALID